MKDTIAPSRKRSPQTKPAVVINGSDAGKAVREMSTPDVQQFLIVCSLVSDLYCPGYNPRQPLATDSNLAQAASRYKVDTPKLAVEVRTELSKKKEKSEAGSTPKRTENPAKRR